MIRLAKPAGSAFRLVAALQAQFRLHVQAALIKRSNCILVRDAETAFVVPKHEQMFSASRTGIPTKDPFLLEREYLFCLLHVFPDNLSVTMATAIVPGD